MVSITPSYLEFKAPFTTPSTEYITITNDSDESIAFKVKTTAPKLYCVRPNAAIVEPGKSLEVSIILLGLASEPEPGFKCTDKFLIVSLPSPYDLGESTVADAWAKLEAEFKPQAISKKIKVKYATDTEVPAAAAPISSLNEESNISKSTPSNLDSAVGAGGATSLSSAQLSEKSPEISKEDRSRIDALNEKLDANVNQPIQSSAKSSKASSSTVATKNSAPIATVLLIALFAFLIGWLFF